MHRLGVATATFCLAACHTTLTGYPFHTRAVYEAPVSGFRFEALTQGHVPAGADLSSSGTGVIRICPLAGSPAAPVTLTFPPGAASVSISTAGPAPATTTATWARKDAAATLSAHLARAGYARLDAAELEETTRAIDGALSGPKATLLTGQTRALSVLSTRLAHEPPKAPLTPSSCGSF